MHPLYPPWHGTAPLCSHGLLCWPRKGFWVFNAWRGGTGGGPGMVAAEGRGRMWPNKLVASGCPQPPHQDLILFPWARQPRGGSPPTPWAWGWGWDGWDEVHTALCVPRGNGDTARPSTPPGRIMERVCGDPLLPRVWGSLLTTGPAAARWLLTFSSSTHLTPPLLGPSVHRCFGNTGGVSGRGNAHGCSMAAPLPSPGWDGRCPHLPPHAPTHPGVLLDTRHLQLTAPLHLTGIGELSFPGMCPTGLGQGHPRTGRMRAAAPWARRSAGQLGAHAATHGHKHVLLLHAARSPHAHPPETSRPSVLPAGAVGTPSQRGPSSSTHPRPPGCPHACRPPLSITAPTPSARSRAKGCC